ncbi:CotH kinase family protein [bacterium]|nr:CotH kinase family protein [bacterium]
MSNKRFTPLALTVVILSLFTIFSTVAIAQDLTLPVYRMSIDQLDLDALNGNPWTSRTFPVVVTINEIPYDCRVRYRGASARNTPKKSWKIFFEEESPGGIDEINLNSEYRDRSLCRNLLCMDLSRYIGVPAPDTRHISLLVNDRFMGVFLEIEQVDEEFFDRRELGYGSLWKAIMHGARFAPFIKHEDLYVNYEPKIAMAGTVDTLGARFSFITFADTAQIADGLNRIVDIENFLRYFAVQYVTGNGDGFTKNYYLFQKPDGRWMLVPWDCDATLGNSWEGNWVDASWVIGSGFLNHQAVFQQLISIPGNRERFLEIIDELITGGFQYISRNIIDIFDEIRHDVYLDTDKRGANVEFELERTRLLEWFENRTSTLTDLNWFNRRNILSVTVEPEYLSEPGESFTVKAVLPETAYSVSVCIINLTGTEDYFELYDDGSHGDSVPGDLVYTSDISLPDTPMPFYYGIYVMPNALEGSVTPPSGWAVFRYWPTTLPVIRLDDDPPQYGDFHFTSFAGIQETGTHYFGLVNSTGRPLNLSGCMLRLAGESFMKMQLRELSPIESGDTLIIANNVNSVAPLFPGCTVTGNFYFPPATGDSVLLETCNGTLLAAVEVESAIIVDECIGAMVINEINYRSSDTFNPGDWIELYCVREIEDLTGWMLKDVREDHIYYFPAGMDIGVGEYLVIARDPELFGGLFPGVEPMIGGFDFGYDGRGDDVRLFDSAGRLIDFVRYDDSDPWPEEPDGEGPTLELMNPHIHNSSYWHWKASSDTSPHGTPGERNSEYKPVELIFSPPVTCRFDAVYPNPFNSRVNIRWFQSNNFVSQLSVYDLQGRRVVVLTEDNYPEELNSITWEADNIAAGVYFLRLENSGFVKFRKVVHLR